MDRLKTLAALLSLTLLAGLPALAPAQTPNVYQSFQSGKQARPHNEIRGAIDSIDYGANMIVVRSGHDRVTVAVLPSTSIYVHDQYASFSDLKRGADVTISASDVDGRLVAQVIRVH